MAGYSVTFTVVDQATKQIDQINRRIAQMRAPMDRMSRSMQKFIDVSGLRKIADGFSWITRTAGMALRTLTAIVPVLGAITGAATITGMVKLIGSFASWGNTLKTTADQVGMNTDELQTWENAYTRAGGSVEDMDASLKNLHQTMGDALTGRNAEALGMFRKLGIDLTDANGKMRATGDVMRDVQKALDGLKDPYDRQKVAADLLGDSQNKVNETFRNANTTLDAAITKERDHARVTQDQLKALNDYRLAMSSLGTTFSTLGGQIAGVLAKNFTPLLQHLDEFVQKHQPEIIAAVDAISDRFAKWLDNPETWKSIEQGAQTLLSTLQLLIDNLDTVKEVAEGIALLFAVKWGVGIANDIATVTRALGAVTGAGGAAGGVGLIGALASIAAWAAVIAQKGDTFLTDDQKRAQEAESKRQAEEYKRLHGTTDPDELNKQQGYTGNFWHDMGVWMGFRGGGGGGAGGKGGVQRESFEPAAKDITPEARGLLKTIASGESKGDYGVLYGGGHFTPGEQFPQWGGVETSAGMTHAAGAYQFQPGTFADVQKATGIKGFTPEEQDKAAWYLAQRDYAARTKGRSLQADLKDPAQAQNIAAVLQPTWTSTRNYGWADQLKANLAKSQAAQVAQNAPTPAAPPAAAPPPAQPVNGQVNVDITHRNAPPDATVTARGSGAVAVSTPRIEHPQLDFGST